MPVIANGVADDTGAVIDAGRNGTQLPPGDIRITSDIINTATASQSPGFILRGSGMQRTRIIADYAPSNADAAGVIRLDASAANNYTYGSVISDLSIVMAPGRTAINGINLVAAWFVKIERVNIFAMRHGIVTPFRPDINAVSDSYQCFAVDVDSCFIRDCDGHGINFSAGQSPALYRVAGTQSILNGSNGINSTTGQCVIDRNVLSYNHGSGVAFETNEGPSMVGRVTQNEIQDNLQYGISLTRSHGLRIIGNRLMSETYSDPTGGHPQNNTPYMRQLAHVYMGTGEVLDLLAEGNMHLSAGGPVPTSNPCYGYLAAAGSLSASYPCRFVHNDFGVWPPNGLSGNSTGFQKFTGPMTGAVIVDP